MRAGPRGFPSPDPDNGYAGTPGYVNALGSADGLKPSELAVRRGKTEYARELRDCYFFYFV